MASHSDSELRIDIKDKFKKSLHVALKAKDRTRTNSEVLGTLKSVLRNTSVQHPNERRLLTAASTNNTDMVHRLLEVNVNPNSIDKQQRSALHLSASRGYTDVVRLLLQYRADPNIQDVIGNTPLHLAACTSNLPIITLLLNAGADVRSLDMHGRNPLQLAESKLQILRQNWKSGTIEMMQLRDQLQQIIDVMISLWKTKRTGFSLNTKENVNELKMMKLSIHSGLEDEVDVQMSRLLEELQGFSLK